MQWALDSSNSRTFFISSQYLVKDPHIHTHVRLLVSHSEPPTPTPQRSYMSIQSYTSKWNPLMFSFLASLLQKTHFWFVWQLNTILLLVLFSSPFVFFSLCFPTFHFLPNNNNKRALTKYIYFLFSTCYYYYACIFSTYFTSLLCRWLEVKCECV